MPYLIWNGPDSRSAALRKPVQPLHERAGLLADPSLNSAYSVQAASRINVYGDVVGALWWRLDDAVPQFQSVCWDEQSGDVLPEANTVPCWWDGTDDGLGPVSIQALLPLASIEVLTLRSSRAM